MGIADLSQLKSNRQPGVAEKTSTARGRKRDPEAHRRVMEVTLRLLRTLGYARLTIERVAKEAGVGRPTIYRWWGSKAELVHEAVFDGVSSVPDADSGVLRDDLRSLVAYLVRILSRPEVVAYFRGVVGELDGRSDLERLSGQRTVLARQKYQDVFEGAITRGEITKNMILMRASSHSTVEFRPGCSSVRECHVFDSRSVSFRCFGRRSKSIG